MAVARKESMKSQKKAWYKTLLGMWGWEGREWKERGREGGKEGRRERRREGGREGEREGEWEGEKEEEGRWGHSTLAQVSHITGSTS